MLQCKIDEGDAAVLELVCREAMPCVGEMMTDPFGNYLAQRIIQHASFEQRLQILRAITDEKAPVSFVTAAMSLHGTRSVQKLVSLCRHPDEVALVKRGMKGSVMVLATDANGNHVVQRCLETLSAADCTFILDKALENCLALSMQRHGCCVMQRCLEHAGDRHKVPLVERILQHTLELCVDPFGNYVIQHVLASGTWEQGRRLVRALLGHISALSRQKFSSNVIEKCLRAVDDGERAAIIAELVAPGVMEALCFDQYGNYVVQCAITVADVSSGALLFEALRPLAGPLSGSTGGRRILGKLEKRFPQQVPLAYGPTQ